MEERCERYCYNRKERLQEETGEGRGVCVRMEGKGGYLSSEM
jgi:hypothetical protein